MKKLVTMLCIAGLVLTLVPATSHGAERAEKGGLKAFFVGCCFGIREGTEWNEGKDLHWREWIPLPLAAAGVIPYIGVIGSIASGVFSIWNGVDCAKGMTSHEFAEKYGTNWY